MSCENLQTMQNELNIILDNNNATSVDYNNFFNKWNIDHNINTSEKNIAQCTQINAAIGSNKVEIPQACTDAAKNLCLSVDNKGKGSPTYDKCWQLYRPSISNINQSNKNTITSNCMVTSILKDPVLSANKKLALLLNMKLAEQKINCDDNKINSFKNSLSSDDKIISISDCINYNIVDQQNLISACNVSDTIQKNISNIVSNCIIKSGNVPINSNLSQMYLLSDIDQNNTENKLNIFDDYYLIIGLTSFCCCISIIIIILIMILK
jgi:hypothetical protein